MSKSEILIVSFNLWWFNFNYHFHIFLKLEVLFTAWWCFCLFVCFGAAGQQCRNLHSNKDREVWGSHHIYCVSSFWVSQICSVSSPHFPRMLTISSITTVRYCVYFCVCLTKTALNDVLWVIPIIRNSTNHLHCEATSLVDLGKTGQTHQIGALLEWFFLLLREKV